jgi:hypothetical protein
VFKDLLRPFDLGEAAVDVVDPVEGSSAPVRSERSVGRGGTSRTTTETRPNPRAPSSTSHETKPPSARVHSKNRPLSSIT